VSVTDAFDWLTQVRREVQELQNVSVEAAERAVNFLYESTVTRARQDPEWTDLADYIQLWSEDGQLVMGVKHRDFISQAFILEFGDEQTPPRPMLRVAPADLDRAEEIVREHFHAIYGWQV
jgi:hypothetical protein